MTMINVEAAHLALQPEKMRVMTPSREQQPRSYDLTALAQSMTPVASQTYAKVRNLVLSGGNGTRLLAYADLCAIEGMLNVQSFKELFGPHHMLMAIRDLYEGEGEDAGRQFVPILTIVHSHKHSTDDALHICMNWVGSNVDGAPLYLVPEV